MILTATTVLIVATAKAASTFDPAWLVAVAGLVGSLGWFFQWLGSRRTAKLREQVEPEVALAHAYRSGVDGFNLLVHNLRDEVGRLHSQVQLLERELETTTRRLVEVQTELASNVTENRRLRSELSRMSHMLSTLDKPPDVGLPGSGDHPS